MFGVCLHMVGTLRATEQWFEFVEHEHVSLAVCLLNLQTSEKRNSAESRMHDSPQSVVCMRAEVVDVSRHKSHTPTDKQLLLTGLL
mmetsp:Transcript_39681/g.127163  ORF Transcript_39681/g.127163 Transcript_39681/m.127163 type:complete len:86 (-) Transcript_39681:130-387(-)